MTQNKDASRTTLTFDLLDNIAELTPTELAGLLRNPVSGIGPLVELVYRAGRLLPALSVQDACTEARLLLRQLSNQEKRPASTTSFTPLPVEFSAIPGTKSEFNEVAWSTFCTRMQKAGERAGVDRRLAQALAGSLDEMASNALEHSGNITNSIAGYRWRPGDFEYIVSDSGIGVLSSLRTNIEYKWISDSGRALEVAIKDGESRYGKGTGRGMGFHDLTINIARRGSCLRFRTGDHALIIDGTDGIIREELRQTGNFDGFLVSVALEGQPTKNPA